MANALYDKARQRFLEGQINWGVGGLGDTIKAVLIDTGTYTVNLAAHEFIDVTAGSRVSAFSAAFANKAVAGGAADANDVTFATVSGNNIEAIVIFKDTGAENSSPLIAYIDTATGLPITPNGGDIIVTWDNGPNKIFKL